MITYSDFYSKTKNYLLSIPLGNKDKTYTPSGYLKKGTTVKSYSPITFVKRINQNRGSKSYEYDTTTPYAYTDDTIPSNLTKAISSSSIENEWKTFYKKYISDKIDNTNYINISSLLSYIYLFRFFLDNKIVLVSDKYCMESVFLYNTNSLTKTPSTVDFQKSEIDANYVSNLLSLSINSIINNRDYISLNAASTTSTTCSSSSSSSSCSSTSSSSSSSSSSSWFIGFLGGV